MGFQMYYDDVEDVMSKLACVNFQPLLRLARDKQLPCCSSDSSHCCSHSSRLSRQESQHGYHSFLHVAYVESIKLGEVVLPR